MDRDTDRVIPRFEDVDEIEQLRRQQRIEPGRPQPEHVLFVLLGIVVTILAFLRGFSFL